MTRALILALALGACGETQEAAAPPPPAEKAPTGVPSTDDSGQPPPVLAAPHNLPSYAPIYRVAVIEQTSGAGPAGRQGGAVTYRTPAAPETVADFYRRELAVLGAVSEARSGASLMLSASRGAERADVTIVPAAEGTRVTIAYELPS